MTTLNSRTDRGYDIKRNNAIVQCVGCELRLQFPMTGRSPEGVAKHIRSKGWAFALGSRSRTRCPRCLEERAEKRAGEKAVKAVEVFGKQVILPAAIAPPDALDVHRFAILIDTSWDERSVRARLDGLGRVVDVRLKSMRKVGSGRYQRTEEHKAKLRELLVAARQRHLAKHGKGPQPKAPVEFS